MVALVVGRQIQGQCGVGGERRGRRGGVGCGRWLAVGGFLELVELLFLHGDYKLIINHINIYSPIFSKEWKRSFGGLFESFSFG